MPDNNKQTFILYHRPACGYCYFTLSEVDHLDLHIERRNIYTNPEYRQELINGGGKSQVPCLRIENGQGKTRWLYESGDIIEYLNEYKRQCM